jgi:hypothetical protein
MLTRYEQKPNIFVKLTSGEPELPRHHSGAILGRVSCQRIIGIEDTSSIAKNC